MRDQGRYRIRSGIGFLILALTGGGCITPGVVGNASSPPPGATPPITAGSAAPANGMPLQTASVATANGSPHPAPPAGSNQPPLPPGTQAAAPVVQAVHETPSQSAAFLSQKLAAADDEHKVLIIRLHQLEANLEARDQALVLASREIGATRTEVAATRTEMERWKREMVMLRERLRSVEKENMGTLESIIKMLEQTLAGEKEAGAAKATAPKPADDLDESGPALPSPRPLK